LAAIAEGSVAIFSGFVRIFVMGSAHISCRGNVERAPLACAVYDLVEVTRAVSRAVEPVQ
jgi:hypothetical protein